MPSVLESVAVVEGGRWRRGARRLAVAAARRALRRAGLTPADVDLLVNAGLYHERLLGEPALAALVQDDLGANPDDPHPGGHGTFSFDVADGSCGMLTGLRVADGFLRTGAVDHALVVASDADPGRGLAPGFPFAPVGAAVVCGRGEGTGGIAGFRASTGSPPGPTLTATVAFDGRRNRLTVTRPAGADAAAGALAGDVAGALLADRGLTPDDLDLVVANPLTAEFLGALADRLGVPPARVGRPRDGRPVHTAGLAVALEAAAPAAGLAGRTALLVSGGAGPAAVAALVLP
ncbi:MAG: 3-oxoacyl-ACP synthase [Acidimicrobiia bacterium]